LTSFSILDGAGPFTSRHCDDCGDDNEAINSPMLSHGQDLFIGWGLAIAMSNTPERKVAMKLLK
jgi:hypothetical protein